MKAVQINAYGGDEVLEVNENALKPSVSPDQILVEVHAASINPFDSFMRAGGLKEKIPLSLPVTLGGDFAGVVVEVGEVVSLLLLVISPAGGKSAGPAPRKFL